MDEQPKEPLITIADVVDYIKARWGVTRSRQTIYNWIKKGAKDAGGQTVKLESTTVAGQAFTTHSAIEAFVTRIDQR